MDTKGSASCDFTTAILVILKQSPKVTVANAFRDPGLAAYVSKPDAVLIADTVDGKWQKGLCDCVNDVRITVGDEVYKYSSPCGTFNDAERGKSLALAENEKNEFNEMLLKYISFGVSFEEAVSVVNIVDETKNSDIALPSMIEAFYRDAENTYFFGAIKSSYVTVHYSDGTTENIVPALASGRATVGDLKRFNIGYFVEPNTETVENFSFSLSWNTYGISSYDSKSGVLIKTTDATSPEDYVTAYFMPEDELARIYQRIYSIDIASYPNGEYDPYDTPEGIEVASKPSSVYELTVRMGEIEKTVRVSDVMLDSSYLSEKGRQFFEVCEYISSFLMSTKEWKALPEYERLYQ